MVDVAIVGAAGYVGAELTRLVLGHPGMRLTRVTSSAENGRRVADVYPALTGATSLAYGDPDPDEIAASAKLVFLAVPHTCAMSLVPGLIESGAIVIDSSADFRLSDQSCFEEWYGVAHACPQLLDEAVYGLPELDRLALPGARLVAAPGCYPTASVLAALPVLRAALAREGARVIIDAKSGVSGAGRNPGLTTHFVTANESVCAYGVTTHRHTPEIEQALSCIAARSVEVVFTPHLVPMSRGLLSTVYIELARPLDTADAITLYAEAYADEPFVTVLEPGRMPATADVAGSNRAHVGVAVDPRTNVLVATCAIDNLVKGAAGQAVQCANAVLGLPETDGLMTIAPVV